MFLQEFKFHPDQLKVLTRCQETFLSTLIILSLLFLRTVLPTFLRAVDDTHGNHSEVEDSYSGNKDEVEDDEEDESENDENSDDDSVSHGSSAGILHRFVYIVEENKSGFSRAQLLSIEHSCLFIILGRGCILYTS